MAQLLFDGDCGFCRYCVEWIKSRGARGVECAPFQSQLEKFPQVPPEEFRKAVHFAGDDGEIVAGASAIYRVLERIPGGWFVFNWLYRRSNAFARWSERAYAWVASHRPTAYRIAKVFLGNDPTPPSFGWVRAVYLRALGAIYVVAFWSFGVQAIGLVGARGVLPAEGTFAAMREQFGWHGLLSAPSLGWISQSDAFIQFHCVMGVIFGLGLIVGVFPRAMAILCWGLYLSLVHLGGIFMQFQWDSLLCEAGLLAIGLAPWAWFLTVRQIPAPRPVWIFLHRFLLWRLMLMSALAKWLGGDVAWRSGAALFHHFETQPLPTWIAWYVHHLPGQILGLGVWVMFFIEGVVPFAFFMGRPWRLAAFWLQVSLQCLIALTGNYTFFNGLTIALCFFLLEDRFVPMPRRLRELRIRSPEGPVGRPWPARAVAGCLVLLGTFQVSGFFGWRPFNEVFRAVEGLRISNPYGLFAVMTKRRPELEIQGTMDGDLWLTYESPYKPGSLTRAPSFVAPHQPRLDWQLWFAALSNFDNETWLYGVLTGILDGHAEVVSLFREDPFKGKPPKEMRILLHVYHFASPEERRATGAWWTRETLGAYSPGVSLPDTEGVPEGGEAPPEEIAPDEADQEPFEGGEEG